MDLPLLVVKTGDTLPSIVERRGDFDRLFSEHVALPGVRVDVVQAHRPGATLPAPRDVAAAIITGSPSSVTALEPWAEELAAWTRRIVDAEVPVLGVCYGHQLLGHAMGGRVTVNPVGYEIGTIAVKLTDEGRADPLLGEIAEGAGELVVNSVHSDAVVELPPNARLLGSNEATPVQAFAVGPRAWGVQFHPEIDDEVMRLYLEGRRPLVTKHAVARGLDPEALWARIASAIRPTPHGPRLLRRFVERFLKR